MTSETIARRLQICNSCGGGAPLDVHFCPQCTKILATGRQGDYFAFMGVPRKLNLDAAELERKFRALSRQFHPDFFYNATPAERRASLERSSYLNDAYRTLRQPISRVAYLLEREGVWTAADRGDGGGAAKQVPSTLLEEVFALNEELDHVRELRSAGAPEAQWKGQLERARGPIDAKRAEHESELQQLSAKWDELLAPGSSDAEKRAVLEALRQRMLERNYINNLLATIDSEVAVSGPQVPGSGPEPMPEA